LPQLDGYEVAQRVRQQPWAKTLFLVALTGWGQEQDKRRAREAGFDDHLVKPVDLTALMKMLSLPPQTEQGHHLSVGSD